MLTDDRVDVCGFSGLNESNFLRKRFSALLIVPSSHWAAVNTNVIIAVEPQQRRRQRSNSRSHLALISVERCSQFSQSTSNRKSRIITEKNHFHFFVCCFSLLCAVFGLPGFVVVFRYSSAQLCVLRVNYTGLCDLSRSNNVLY